MPARRCLGNEAKHLFLRKFNINTDCALAHLKSIASHASGVPWVNASGGGGGAPSGKVINARERSDRAGGGSGRGVSPSQVGRFFNFAVKIE